MKTPENFTHNENVVVTEHHEDLFQDYLKWLNENGGLQAKHYDHVGEFHMSGYNSKLADMMNGNYPVNSVSFYQENNETKRIHIDFLSSGNGDNIDFYLEGKALDDYFDYLKNQKSQEVFVIVDQVVTENTDKAKEEQKKIG